MSKISLMVIYMHIISMITALIQKNKLKKNTLENYIQKSFLSKKGLESLNSFTNGLPFRCCTWRQVTQLKKLKKGTTKGRSVLKPPAPPKSEMLWRWKLAKKILPHQVHHKTLITYIYTPQVERMDPQKWCFPKKTRLFQGDIFRWTVLDSGRLFSYSPIKTGPNHTKMPDTWSTRPHRTCLKGKRNLALKKTIPNPRKMGKCYNVEVVWAGQMLTLQWTITYPT